MKRKHQSNLVREGIIAFSAGLIVMSVMLMTGFWDARKKVVDDGAHVGDKVMIQSDCEWVQVLVSSVPTIRWTNVMTNYCGGFGTIIAVDTTRGVVKLKHEDGAKLGWPLSATSIAPKKPHPSFTSGRLRRANHYVDRLEERLSSKHEERIQKLLDGLKLTKYFDKMIQVGLDTLEIVVASGDEERDIAKISHSDWKLIKDAATAMLKTISKLQADRDFNKSSTATGSSITKDPTEQAPRIPTNSMIRPPTKLPLLPDGEPEETLPPIPSLKVKEQPKKTPPPMLPDEQTLPPIPSLKSSSETDDKKQVSLNEVKTVSFIHIPKAGGTAFTTALRAVLGCSLEACEGFPSQHESCPAFTGCYDHKPLRLSTKQSRTNGTTSLLAINVRHPVERIISAFHHGSREWPCCGLPQRSTFRDRLFHAKGKEGAFTVGTFSDEVAVQNCMTKMILGKECKQPYSISEDTFSQAVANLKLFDVVLIQEYVPESIKLLACVSGKPLDDPKLHKQYVFIYLTGPLKNVPLQIINQQGP